MNKIKAFFSNPNNQLELGTWGICAYVCVMTWCFMYETAKSEAFRDVLNRVEAIYNE